MSILDNPQPPPLNEPSNGKPPTIEFNCDQEKMLRDMALEIARLKNKGDKFGIVLQPNNGEKIEDKKAEDAVSINNSNGAAVASQEPPADNENKGLAILETTTISEEKADGTDPNIQKQEQQQDNGLMPQSQSQQEQQSQATGQESNVAIAVDKNSLDKETEKDSVFEWVLGCVLGRSKSSEVDLATKSQIKDIWNKMVKDAHEELELRQKQQKEKEEIDSEAMSATNGNKLNESALGTPLSISSQVSPKNPHGIIGKKKKQPPQAFLRDYWEFHVKDHAYPRDPYEWYENALATGSPALPGEPMVHVDLASVDPKVIEENKERFSLYVQESGCLNYSRSTILSMCLACIRRQAGDGCRFSGIRALIVTKEATKEVTKTPKRKGIKESTKVRYYEGPAFISSRDFYKSEIVSFSLPHSQIVPEEYRDLAKWLFHESPPGSQERSWIEKTIIIYTSKMYLKMLKDEQVFMRDFTDAEREDEPLHACNNKPCLLKRPVPEIRELCDGCDTSVWAGFYFCPICGYAICKQCFLSWDDSMVKKPVVSSQELKVLKPGKITTCLRKRVAPKDLRVILHKKTMFLRASKFTKSEVDYMVNKIQKAISMYEEDLNTKKIMDGSSYDEVEGGISEERRRELMEESNRIGWMANTIPPQLEEWERPVIRVEAGKISLEEFSRLWRANNVIVVTGLLDHINRKQWTPQWLSKNHGNEAVEILDCARYGASVGVWKLKEFFHYFDQDIDAIDIPLELAVRDDTDLDDHTDDEEEYMTEKKKQNNFRGKRIIKKKVNDIQLSDMRWVDKLTYLKNGILKIKDWPPKEDFKSRLPDHFKDYMNVLPFQAYTNPDGLANLASWLPKGACPPDLGPKMYLAYGSWDDKGGPGTTNLHCDMADAANLMVYCSKDFLRKNKIPIPGIWTPDMDLPSTTSVPAVAPEVPAPETTVGVTPIDTPQAQNGADKQIDTKPILGAEVPLQVKMDVEEPANVMAESEPVSSQAQNGADDKQPVNSKIEPEPEARQVHQKDSSDQGNIEPKKASEPETNEVEEEHDLKPAAAVWDIYPPGDLPVIREYLKKRHKRMGYDIGDVDVIHNQDSFLTTDMRKRLYDPEKGKKVRGWRIYQNPGDAVFVPAGCAHQVCNYANAIKVAVDFVSPERVDQCERVTNEFRSLPHAHPRSMDALQLKNMLWYAFSGLQNVPEFSPRPLGDYIKEYPDDPKWLAKKESTAAKAAASAAGTPKVSTPRRMSTRSNAKPGTSKPRGRPKRSTRKREASTEDGTNSESFASSRLEVADTTSASLNGDMSTFDGNNVGSNSNNCLVINESQEDRNINDDATSPTPKRRKGNNDNNDRGGHMEQNNSKDVEGTIVADESGVITAADYSPRRSSRRNQSRVNYSAFMEVDDDF
ncbi:hypothetical protein H4219_004764 [Mycoemilia scoparia]|uniref:JmjC domain-containing protein n=1 Tax=Mycoemilia scoparia TaxID=417184 RepID=A0A9W8A041_9FUNG|nr:hypothetical protein H4219_004764 [Mycoemilia scoparia]